MSYAVDSVLRNYCSRLQSLHTDRRADGGARPHKAVMVLAVLSLADNGQLTENRIVYGPELLDLFKRFFLVVRGPTDQCTPWNPFFHLRREGFWHLHPLAGKAAVLESVRAPHSAGVLQSTVAYASLEDDLFGLVTQPVSRETLRLAIVERYFSAQQKEVLALCGEERDIGRVRETWQNNQYQVGPEEASGTPESVRSTAFARTVRQAYDHRCAACGIRFLFESITIIDAAHLIPFERQPDNSPQNGMALCKNHHWLMDCRLIAPGPARGSQYDDLRWHVRKGLNERIEGQREVLRLRNKTVILPSDERLRPKREAIDHRMDMLVETY